MTIIDVARELEKDGTKKFYRPSWGQWKMGAMKGDLFDINPVTGGLSFMQLDLDDLLATDWEEVKKES